jgi:hypothetical protein
MIVGETGNTRAKKMKRDKAKPECRIEEISCELS